MKTRFRSVRSAAVRKALSPHSGTARQVPAVRKGLLWEVYFLADYGKSLPFHAVHATPCSKIEKNACQVPV